MTQEDVFVDSPETTAAITVPVESYSLDVEDNTIAPSVLLPTQEDINAKGVLRNVKDIYRGFSFDDTEDFSKRFQTTDQIAEFVKASLTDVGDSIKKAEITEVLHKGAAMARFWYMSAAIDKALTNGNYGTATCERIAAQLRKSAPYVYQIRAVGNKLTVTDCYLLGMRGCTSTTLKHLADVKDPDMRSGIIRAFIDATTDLSDKVRLADARKAFNTAIQMKDAHNFIQLASSDPARLQEEAAPLTVSECYNKTSTAIINIRKMVKAANKETAVERICNAIADFSISSSIPDAEEHLAALKEEAGNAKEMCRVAINNINDIIRELDSLMGVEVLTDEATDSEGGDN